MARHGLLNLARWSLLVTVCVIVSACYDPTSTIYDNVFRNTAPLNGQCFSIQADRVESVVIANDDFDLSIPKEYIFIFSGGERCAFFLNDSPLLFFTNRPYYVRADIREISSSALLAADLRSNCVASVLVANPC